MLILYRLFLLKSIAIEPGLLELLQKVAGVRFFLRHNVFIVLFFPTFGCLGLLSSSVRGAAESVVICDY